MNPVVTPATPEPFVSFEDITEEVDMPETKTALEHVLEVIKLPFEAQQVLFNNAINTIAMLVSCDDDDLTYLQKLSPQSFLMGHAKSLLMFKKWCIEKSCKVNNNNGDLSKRALNFNNSELIILKH